MKITDSKIVAIHQPNFFPWLGYFDKIVRSDAFIALDNVQFPKTGGTWTNRVKLLIGNQAAWCTVPIVRSYHGVQTIKDMRINNTVPWREKILKTLQASYGRAPFFGEVFPLLQDLINNPTERLAEYNFAAIQYLLTALNLEPGKLALGSNLVVEGQATELLIRITSLVGGTGYLCGGGASSYQEDHMFGDAGITLIYQNFQHPTYQQFNMREFVPGLSIIDVLMNCGLEHTRSLLVHQKQAYQDATAVPDTSNTVKIPTQRSL